MATPVSWPPPVAAERPPLLLEPPAGAGGRVTVGLGVGAAAAVASYASADAPLDASPDAAFVAALPVAMAVGSSLAVPDGVSPRLRGAAPQIQRLLSAWDAQLRPVELRGAADGGPAVVDRPAKRGCAAFFTGGVDSFYTVLTRRSEIDALIHVHGFDLALDEQPKRALVSASLREVAAALELPLIEVETDLRALSDPVCGWELVYTGAALASVAHLLASRFERVLIPATHSLRDLHPIGTHPLLDPLYSSELLAIEHVDSVPRVDKLAQLAESELAMGALRVCFQPGVDGLNCGRCHKCMRTMTGLRVVGALGRCRTLPGDLSLREMSGGKVVRRQSLTYVWENLAAVEARAGDPDLALALRRLVARGARTEAWRETRLLARAVRRSVAARPRRFARRLRARLRRPAG
jgi:hypothetical protein